jgi:DNA-binding NtrC family response regulator
LENAVFRAVVLAESDCIGCNEFPQIGALLPREDGLAASAAADRFAALPSMDEFPSIAENFGIAAEAAASARPDYLPLLDSAGQIRPLQEMETELIRFAITHYRGQMSEVARRLRIGRSTLYRKLEYLGLEDSEAKKEAESVAAK